MNDLWVCFAAFSVAAAVSLFLTPKTIRWALALKVVAHPGARKIHKEPIPSWGGVAVMIGFVAGLIPTLIRGERPDPTLFATLVGLVGIGLLGTLDDAKGLRPLVKLMGQILVAVLPVAAGLRISFFQNPLGEGYIFLSSFQSFAVTVFWIVLLTNALNLIDGLDGLAAGVSLMAGLTLCFFALSQGPSYLTVAACFAATAGACAGFLPFNLHPAKVFLGDTGAMSLGYLFATLSVSGAVKSVAALSVLAITVLVLAYPIGDTLFAIIRRWLSGKSIFSADRGHLHHRLMDQGLDHPSAVLFLYLLTMTLCLLAFVLGRV
ncbi:MAG: undecaprenyl/decaprenyl-phosphate alpha-N-acetylglucosaminyl 1-phosphate transferase [Armatimonadetes bacterium]|nr:undecaprenyl/decaprenyl-phosphate alpha-N-acetylglucosaminyl 1-phosphate transferase [Armatimonadota bacterium]MDW8122337.1 MraY family glycosyltransferase [Armatimonadota bacterium]